MKKRIITGFLIGVIVIPLILIGNIPFLVGILLLLGGVSYEVSNIKKHPLFIKIITILLICGTTLYNYFNLKNNINEIDVTFMFLPIFIYYLIALWYEKFDFKEATFLSLFTILMILFGKSILYIRSINDSANALAYLLITTCSVDIFALFIGGKFGKHKLNERISPKKSIEGSIGGIVCTIIISSIFNFFFPILDVSNTSTFLNLNYNNNLEFIEPVKVLLITLILTITGQIGDLFFSMIKRNYEIKDFSNLLPGHGGLTDRIDSVCINSIIFMLVFNLLIL